MFWTLPWRFAHFPFWHASTGADRAVSTPGWKDLAVHRPDESAGAEWDLVTDMAVARAQSRQILHLFGQVIDFDGQPCEGVTVEIWQPGPDGTCGPDGGRSRSAEVAAHGAVQTNRFGGYRFRTLLPVDCGSAPPHIDARLTPRSGRVLATRLYLLNDPRNAADWHFASLGPSRQAALTLDPVKRDDGAWEAGFNFVI